MARRFLPMLHNPLWICNITLKITLIWIIRFVIFSSFTTRISQAFEVQIVPQKAIKLSGDIILGGLFPMHEKGTGGEICGDIKEEKGIQRVEAMLYAIDKINSDPQLLPNITLGAHILDTCLRDTYALEQSLEFIKAHMSTLAAEEEQCEGRRVRFTPNKPVAGVIGAAASPVSIMVANILRLFKIPQISYASTGIELSDKDRFGYFSRVVPPDTYQAQAMVDVVKTFGWRYVATLADEGNYGEKGIAAFEELSGNNGICIARSLKIPREIEPHETFEGIINELTRLEKVKIVVLFVNEDNCKRLINASIAMRQWNRFYFLASDSWGAKAVPVQGQEGAAEGTITILPQKKRLQEFDDYMTRLTPANNKRNPWFKEFWEKHFDCTFGEKLIPSGKPLCTGQERISHTRYKQEGIVPFVVDAVYAMAHALNNMRLHNCRNRRQPFCHKLDPPDGAELLRYIHEVSFTGGERIGSGASRYDQEGLVPFVVDAVYAMAHALDNYQREVCSPHDQHAVCKAMLPLAGPQLLQHIRNVTFIGVSGHKVRFNELGDAMGRYNIYQFQRLENGKYDYVAIGNWSDRRLILPFNVSLQMDMGLVKWKHDSRAIPKSVCSEPCGPGEVQSSKSLDSCCWVCIRCTEFEIMREKEGCELCPNGSLPNWNKTTCERLPVSYMAIGSAWAIVPVCFSILGILMVIFTMCVFIKFDSTPVIMASGRELCYVLLFGLFLSYAMTFVMVSKPSLATCTLMRLGLGLSLSLCYSALLTKTNRISRIFNRGVKAMVKRPSYTSPRSQLVICFTLVSVQILGAVTWMCVDFPATTHVFPDRYTVVLRCKSTNISVVLSLLYNMLLILLCTVYAFKTRKIPENFNEAKYIAFTMYSTCIVWLAFIPIYFGTHKSDFRIQITALCMCVSISATVAFGCLFVPKLHIVLFQPHKNVRAGAKPGSGSGRPLFGQKSSRFTSLGAMNGDITSPTGLALLIAQSTTGMAMNMAKPQPQPDTPQTHPNVKFEPVKTDEVSCQDLDTSEPEPEADTTAL